MLSQDWPGNTKWNFLQLFTRPGCVGEGVSIVDVLVVEVRLVVVVVEVLVIDGNIVGLVLGGGVDVDVCLAPLSIQK